MPIDVVVQAVAEGIVAERGDELLDDGSALLVGDGIEVADRLVGVLDQRGDRMRGDQLVLAVGRRAHLAVEDVPGVAEARGVGKAAIGEVRGEGLIEPEVIPPAHGDQVTEPHVGELVQDDLAAYEPLHVGRRVAEQEAVVERDRPDVLHGPGVELGHEELVVLAEGIASPEQVGVVVHPLAGDLEDLVRAAFQLGPHRSSAVEPHGDAVVRRLDQPIGTGDEREQVRREASRGRGSRALAVPGPRS